LLFLPRFILKTLYKAYIYYKATNYFYVVMQYVDKRYRPIGIAPRHHKN